MPGAADPAGLAPESRSGLDAWRPIVLWGMIALRLAPPIMLLQIAANVGGLVFVMASLHVLYVNRTLLPPPVRPSLARCAVLVAMAAF